MILWKLIPRKSSHLLRPIRINKAPPDKKKTHLMLLAHKWQKMTTKKRVMRNQAGLGALRTKSKSKKRMGSMILMTRFNRRSKLPKSSNLPLTKKSQLLPQTNPLIFKRMMILRGSKKPNRNNLDYLSKNR